MASASTEYLPDGRWTTIAPDHIHIDPEFAAMIPRCGRSEDAQFQQDLRTNGCLQPLILWQNGEEPTLLDGHRRLRFCRADGIAFSVEYRDFPSRHEAKEFVRLLQLGRRNLTPEGYSFLRGERYLQERQTHGGHRASGQGSRLKTSQRLAREFNVDERTIRRDGQFTEAVQAIAALCGLRAQEAILAADSGMKRTRVLQIARLPEAEQRRLMDQLCALGNLPRRPRRKRPPGTRTICFPADALGRAAVLVQAFGVDGVHEMMRALPDVLKGQAALAGGDPR